ncbi:MAG: PDZ domain-containing protein [Deltaproteobacteria bacterium]|nr:PDZ domain-containing protein [Deltaproteobacteria bacterium]
MDFAAIAQSGKVRYLGQFITVTLGVYLISTLVVFYTNWTTARLAPPFVEEAASIDAGPRTDHPLDFYRAVWERNLFSVKVQEDELDRRQKLMAQIDQLALTTLNCTLIGTIIHEGDKSWAVIMDNQSGKQDKYTVGEKLRNAEVVMILRNQVVLNINGKNERLIMGIEKIRAEDRSIEGGAAESPGGVETYKISKDFVAQSVNNIAQIMSTVRVKPHFEDGKPAGFQVSNIKSDSILKTMGFKEGDIIRSVNGQEIRTAEDVMRLYNTLKDSSFFGIGLVRNGQPTTLNFKVR